MIVLSKRIQKRSSRGLNINGNSSTVAVGWIATELYRSKHNIRRVCEAYRNQWPLVVVGVQVATDQSRVTTLSAYMTSNDRMPASGGQVLQNWTFISHSTNRLEGIVTQRTRRGRARATGTYRTCVPFKNVPPIVQWHEIHWHVSGRNNTHFLSARLANIPTKHTIHTVWVKPVDRASKRVAKALHPNLGAVIHCSCLHIYRHGSTLVSTGNVRVVRRNGVFAVRSGSY